MLKLSEGAYPIKSCHALTSALGGGLKLGQTALFVVPIGAGATVLACQIASDLAWEHRMNGLLVNSEESAQSLETRIASRVSRCPFDLAKKGMAYYSREQKSNLTDAQDVLGTRLHIFGSTPLREAVQQVEHRFGRDVNFIVLDATSDADEERAVKLVEMCRSAKMIGVVFARAGVGAEHNAAVKSEHSFLGKKIGPFFDKIVGVSALQDSNIHRTRQEFYTEKLRDANRLNGYSTAFDRNFSMQEVCDP